MKSILLKKPFEISVAEIEDKKCPEGEVKVEILSMGICGSDVAAYKGTSPLVTYPRVIGHELVGRVIEVKGEADFKIGDMVALEPYIYCGVCYPCSIDRTNCCENLSVLGVHRDGGMCEKFCHPIHLTHKVEGISLEKAAIIEPLTISLHAIHRLDVKVGEHVLIFGAGPIGHLAAQAAMVDGGIPIVVDIVDERLKLAESVGVEFTINSAKEDLIKRVSEITNGRMAECVVEATGAAPCVRASIDVVSAAGRIAFVGWPHEEILLPTAIFTRKELDLRGSRNSKGEFPLAIELIREGKINVDPIISEVVSFDELPEAVVKLAENPGKYLKIVGVRD